MVKIVTKIAMNNRPIDKWVNGLSCGKVNFPKRYAAHVPKIAIHIPIKTSLSNK